MAWNYLEESQWPLEFVLLTIQVVDSPWSSDRWVGRLDRRRFITGRVNEITYSQSSVLVGFSFPSPLNPKLKTGYRRFHLTL